MGLLSDVRLRLRALILPAFFALSLGAAFLAVRRTLPALSLPGDAHHVARQLRQSDSSPGIRQGPSGGPPSPQALPEGAAQESSRASRNPPGSPPDENGIPLTPKQKRELMKSEFEKMKRDAADLAALAQSLQEDLEQSNEHLLSMKIVEKARKIENLAKRISRTAKSY